MNIQVENHEGVTVARDLLPGGTKSRYLSQVYQHTFEVVYASSAEGTAQVALAATAKKLAKRCTIFGPARSNLHPRQAQAVALGANFIPVRPGYLNVVQARARAYVANSGAHMLPFGGATPNATDVIAETAYSLKLKPDYVWCASGSGTLIKGLAKAFPNADCHVVLVGHMLSSDEVAGATRHESLFKYSYAAPASFAPFDCDPHYERKAYHVLKQWRATHKPKGSILFWSVTGAN